MRRILLFFPAFVLLLWACNPKQYDDYQEKDVFGSWAVIKSSKTFGITDSLNFLINPVTTVLDSIYYNGNYTDSYFHLDSTRVMLRYTTCDSIYFHLDRMYSVEINPSRIVMTLTAQEDTLKRRSVLHLTKSSGSDKIYYCGPDSTFRNLLESGKLLHGYATNDSSTSQPPGSQNYEFILPTAEFGSAFFRADSLNNPAKYARIMEAKADSIEKKDSTLHKKKHHRL